MNRLLVVALAFVTASALAQTTIHNDDSCDLSIAPAATLLLPYFEVDIAAPRERAQTTLFTVTNVTGQPQIARVTLWTDWAYPVLTFNLFLTGYDVQSIDLHDVIAGGRIARTSNESPRGAFSALDSVGNVKFLPTAFENCSPSRMPATLAAEVLRDVQSALTTGASSSCGAARVGGTHANAIGYATIDLVADCTFTLPIESRYYTEELLFDNVLISDFQVVNPNPALGNLAFGEPLVHIRAVPEGGRAGSLAGTNLPLTFYDRYTPAAHRGVDRRQPLPSVFAARFIQGGATGFLTNFMIWREGVTGAASVCSSYQYNALIDATETVRFDERENATTLPFPIVGGGIVPVYMRTTAASSVPSFRSSLPPLASSGDVAGWMYFNLHNRAPEARASQSWVVVGMYAEGRYATAYTAVPLGNGCSPPAGILSRIGPRP